MDAKDFSQTVIAQIRAGAVEGARGGLHAMMCWGYNTPQCGKDTEGIPFLRFKVTGHKHTGWVRISIFCDTYVISLAKTRGKDREFHEVVRDVYCEDLAQILDNLIET